MAMAREFSICEVSQKLHNAGARRRNVFFFYRYPFHQTNDALFVCQAYFLASFFLRAFAPLRFYFFIPTTEAKRPVTPSRR